MRSPVSLDVMRDRNSLYRLTDDGHVDNVYTLRILNKTEHEQRFRIEARGASALTLLPGDREYRVASGAVYSLPLRVRRAAYEPLGAGDHHAHGALGRRSADPCDHRRALPRAGEMR